MNGWKKLYSNNGNIWVLYRWVNEICQSGVVIKGQMYNKRRTYGNFSSGKDTKRGQVNLKGMWSYERGSVIKYKGIDGFLRVID